MSDSQRAPDREMFDGLCSRYGIRPEVVTDLLRIEKEYQLQNKRHGIYDRLRECVQGSVQVEERRD